MDKIEVQELTRFQSVQDQWSEIESFLDFLKEKDIFLAEQYGPERLKRATETNKQLIADFYEIDLIKVAEEKEQVVQQFLTTIA